MHPSSARQCRGDSGGHQARDESRDAHLVCLWIDEIDGREIDKEWLICPSSIEAEERNDREGVTFGFDRQ